jgi:hypothetical protein
MAQQPAEPLVSREHLEKLVDRIEGVEPFRDYLKERWIGMILWWHGRAVDARAKYIRLRLVTVIGGVSIPVLTTLSMREELDVYVTVLIALVGAAVAGTAAWEGVANYGDTWREKRRAAELLKVEGWQFLQLTGPYQHDKNHHDAFPRFATAVEAMIAKEVGEYLAVFDSSVAQSRAAAEKVIDAIAEEARKRVSFN